MGEHFFETLIFKEQYYVHCILVHLSCRLYQDEVSKSKTLNELLGIGVGAFQGMANLAINGLALVVLYYGGSLLANREMEPGDLMSFLVATQTIQRYIQ